MLGSFFILMLGLAEPLQAKPLQDALDSSNSPMGMLPGGLSGTTTAMQFPIYAKSYTTGDMDVPEHANHEETPKRVTRGAKGGRSRQRERQELHNLRDPRPHDPDGFFTTPSNVHFPNKTHREVRNDTNSIRIHNPLYPVTDSSYGAYAVMLLSLMVFAVGIIGNLAVMCIVWHNYYMKTAWNCILASLAFWDFLVLFFCLPIVIFNELTKRRLMGDLSCRIVPYMEVSSGHENIRIIIWGKVRLTHGSKLSYKAVFFYLFWECISSQ